MIKKIREYKANELNKFVDSCIVKGSESIDIVNYLWQEIQELKQDLENYEKMEKVIYDLGASYGESKGVTRVLDILEELDEIILEKVIDTLYDQDFRNGEKEQC